MSRFGARYDAPGPVSAGRARRHVRCRGENAGKTLNFPSGNLLSEESSIERET